MTTKPVILDSGNIVLWNADCLQVLPTLEPGSVDCVVTDPPYVGLVGGYDRANIIGAGAPAKQSAVSIGDEWNASFEWVAKAKRIARLGAIVFCTYHSLPETATEFTDWRRVLLWTWYKRNSPPTGANVPRFTEEYIWGFAKAVGLKWDAVTQTLIDMPKLQAGWGASPERVIDSTLKAVHPTQKPIAVMLRVMEVCPSDSSILDPFMGLGTTGVACVRTGRRFIGIELDPGYFAIAVKRIQTEIDARDSTGPLMRAQERLIP